MPSDPAAARMLASGVLWTLLGAAVLVDHARSRGALKRGGDLFRVSLAEAESHGDGAADVIALDEALSGLESLDPRKARVIELRYFGGLSVEETAEVLELSVATVGKEARLARVWLFRELSAGGDGEPA